MSITINGTTLGDSLNTFTNVCTSYYNDWGTNYYGTLYFNLRFVSCTETDTTYNVGWRVELSYDGPYSRSTGNKLNHTGNGLQLKPYYHVKDTPIVYAETHNMVLYNSAGTVYLYGTPTVTDHVWSVPKQSKRTNVWFGCLLKGVWTNESNGVVTSVWDPAVAGWPGGHYPFFNADNKNSEPGYVSPANSWFSKDVYTSTTAITMKALSNYVYVYNGSSAPKPGKVYVYGSDGKPHAATNIYIYGSDGKPRKIG